jgi:hypothetical protein
MKRRVALRLRRLADRLDPAYLRSYDITYQAGMPTHVDLRFRSSGKRNRRVFGYVDSTERIQ